jgi:hypothetical protein
MPVLAYDGSDEFAIRPVKPALDVKRVIACRRDIRRVMTLVPNECMSQVSIPVKVVKVASAKAYK